MSRIIAGVHVTPPGTVLDLREELGATSRKAIAVVGSADAIDFWSLQTGTGATIVRMAGTGVRANYVSTNGRGSGTDAIDWELARKADFGSNRRRRLTWESWQQGNAGIAGIASDNMAFTAAASYAGYVLWFTGTGWRVRRQLHWGGADEDVMGERAMSAGWHHVKWEYTEGSLPELAVSVDGEEWYRTATLADFPDTPPADGRIFCPRMGGSGAAGDLWTRGNRLLLEYL